MKQFAWLVSISMAAAPIPAIAESQEEIVCALDPKCGKPATRSLQRGITSTGDRKDELPSINLYVNFAFNSDKLETDARITLDQLGAALRDPRLERFRFRIAGHTDAKGNAAYNQKLSERRAEAVRRYLMDRFRFDAGRLEAIGYGKSRLLDPARPDDGINRRVQILNLTAAE